MIREFELDHRFENLGHIFHQVQSHKNENLPICQWDFQKYEIGQVQYDDHQKWVIQFKIVILREGLAMEAFVSFTLKIIYFYYQQWYLQ